MVIVMINTPCTKEQNNGQAKGKEKKVIHHFQLVQTKRIPRTQPTNQLNDQKASGNNKKCNPCMRMIIGVIFRANG